MENIAEMRTRALLSKKTKNPCFTNPNHSLYEIMLSLQQVPEIKELILLLKMDKEKQNDFLLSNAPFLSLVQAQIFRMVAGGVTLNHLEAFGLSREARELLGKKYHEKDGEGLPG